MSTGELACTYATMILADDGIPITAEKIATLLKAANVECESYWPGLFAKLAEKKNIEDLIMNVGVSGAAAAVDAPAVAGSAAAAAPAVEEKKEETKEEESDDDFVSGLFD
ncbi:large ribosomal subunit protein P1-like isoform X2 [Bidens hawaiensis]|uniref:large ribosomal subunit protein P1-like isoform X2 n=1 Tax=Bidens hawaiensis TaxID=980011 RepID=UPI0040499C95